VRPPGNLLAAAVLDLVESVVAALAAVDGAAPRPMTTLRDELWRDGLAIAAGVIDSDAALADVEIVEYLGALAHRYPDVTPARYTPEQVRGAGLLTAAARFLDQVPPLCVELHEIDRRHGTAAAAAYYDGAMRIAFTAASLDDVPSPFELNAVDGFRSLLLPLRVAAPTGASAGSGPAGATAGPAGPTPGAQPGDDAPARPLEDLLAELDALTGLAPVKHEVRLVTALVQVQKLREARGMRTMETSRHLIFVGNPGTGKTTVARLVAQIYRALGVVSRGHLVETDRAGLVAGYVGQTAAKVEAMFDRADQGVLLIDEAYALVRGGERDFGIEAIDAIVKLVEDRRDRVVVIMAGYVDEMETLIDANPGLSSRFPRTIVFPDYTDEELCRIFDSIAAGAGYETDTEARAVVAAWVRDRPRGRGFGNAREIRNLFEASIARHAVRVTRLAAPTDDDLRRLLAVDLADAPPAG
jgi:hypothetical protein